MPLKYYQDKLDEDAKKEYEDKRDTAAGVLEQLIETFDACTVESIDETKRLVEAMEIMTETVTTLTLTSQVCIFTVIVHLYFPTRILNRV